MLVKTLERRIGEVVPIRSFNADRIGKIVGIYSEFFETIGLLSYIVEFPDGSREVILPQEISVIIEKGKKNPRYGRAKSTTISK